MSIRHDPPKRVIQEAKQESINPALLDEVVDVHGNPIKKEIQEAKQESINPALLDEVVNVHGNPIKKEEAKGLEKLDTQNIPFKDDEVVTVDSHGLPLKKDHDEKEEVKVVEEKDGKEEEEKVDSHGLPFKKEKNAQGSAGMRTTQEVEGEKLDYHLLFMMYKEFPIKALCTVESLVNEVISSRLE